MARTRIQIAAHLSDVELTQRYNDCQDDKIKSYWRVIQLLNQQNPYLTVEQVAEQVGFSCDWIRKLVHRYNRFGPDKLADWSRSVKKTTRGFESSKKMR